ncbi:MAG TPA: hypothetical protein VGL99_23725 [Chloroflexota bacterium]
MHEVVRVVARDCCPRHWVRGTGRGTDSSAGCSDHGAGGDQATGGRGIARDFAGRVAGSGQAGRISVASRVTGCLAGGRRKACGIARGSGSDDVERHLPRQHRVPDELVARA